MSTNLPANSATLAFCCCFGHKYTLDLLLLEPRVSDPRGKTLPRTIPEVLCSFESFGLLVGLLRLPRSLAERSPRALPMQQYLPRKASFCVAA